MGTGETTNPPPLSGTTCGGSGLRGFGPVITNGATGVAVFAGVSQYASGDCTVAPLSWLQISYVSQDSPTSQVTGAVNRFLPALQREDGSYIGTDGNENLIALGLDGSVLWQQPIGAPGNGA